MKDFIKKIADKFSKSSKNQPLSRKQLEKKVEKGAQKAINEYRRVFERLAEYDRR